MRRASARRSPRPTNIALVHGAPHAANGKKLIDFLLSKEAQETVSSIARGLPGALRREADATRTSSSCMTFMQGVTVWAPDWDAVLKDLSADVARWHEVTGS